MDITRLIAEMKRNPDFARRVGAILTSSRIVKSPDTPLTEQRGHLDVNPDHKRLDLLCREYENRDGVYRIAVETQSGRLRPGDTVLSLLIAGDNQETLQPILNELLDRIKNEAVRQQEITG